MSADAFRTEFAATLKALRLTQTQVAGKFDNISDRQLRTKLDDTDWLRTAGLAELVETLKKLNATDWRDEFETRLIQALHSRTSAPQAQAPEVAIPTLPPPDTPLAEATRAVLRQQLARPVTDIPGYIAHRYAQLRLHKLGGPESDDHASFVNLLLQPVPERGVEPKPEQFESLPDMLAAYVPEKRQRAEEPIWQLRGEPGAGKSTLLLDLEIHRAYDALALWRADPQARPEVCVRVSLAGLDAAGLDVAAVDAWVQARWQADCRHLRRPGDRPPKLADLAQGTGLRFLLDGLNEIVAADSTQRQKALKALAEWATAEQRAGHPAPVFTVRRLNYLGFATGPDVAASRVADVDPWGEEQIKPYCERRFPGRGNPLWRAIDSHADRRALVELFGNPFNLALQCWLFEPDPLPDPDKASDASLAANRGELMGRIGLQRLHAAIVRADDAALAAPGPFDADADSGDIARLAVRRPPAALHEARLRGSFLYTLQNLALALHETSRGGWAEWADDAEPGGLPLAQWRPALKAAESLQMAVRHGSQHRYSHQLWQEYFAACALALGRGWERIDLRPPAPAAVNPDDWELPAPEPSFWDQCVQLAVQIAPPAEADALLERLLADNLALAGRAAAGRPGDIDAGLLRRIKQALLQRSTAPQADLRERIEAGLLLGRLGDDIRYLEGTGPDGHRYLLPRDDGGLIEIPAGRHTVGGLDEYADSRNTVEVDIASGLRLAFAPVTNAEFACFMAAEGYGTRDAETPPAWWLGTAATAWWRGETANEGLRDDWVRLRQDWQMHGRDTAVDWWLSGMRPEAIDLEVAPKVALDDAKFKAYLDTLCAPRREREPGWWRSSAYNNPLQPVVGLSLWEAEAYCRWLSRQSGRTVRLPTEAEWEVAARGGGRRGVHWPGTGSDGPGPQQVNQLETRVRRTTPVGVFPGSTTEEGWVDMAGNVWEWTASAWTEDAIHKDKIEAALSPDDSSPRSVRGGSWDLPGLDCRAAVRLGYHPGGRNSLLGLRVVVCPIQSPEP